MCQTFAFDIHLALICDVQTFVGLELVSLLIGHYAPRRVVCEQDRIVSGKHRFIVWNSCWSDLAVL